MACLKKLRPPDALWDTSAELSQRATSRKGTSQRTPRQGNRSIGKTRSGPVCCCSSRISDRWFRSVSCCSWLSVIFELVSVTSLCQGNQRVQPTGLTLMNSEVTNRHFEETEGPQDKCGTKTRRLAGCLFRRASRRAGVPRTGTSEARHEPTSRRSSSGGL